MKTARSIALAAVVATIPACSGGIPCDAVLSGYPYGEMPNLDMLVGDTVETVVWRHFVPPNCQASKGSVQTGYMARSSDTAAVAVSIPDSLLTTAAVGVADSVRVTVWTLYDGYTEWPTHEGPHFHEFHVRVRPRPAGR